MKETTYVGLDVHAKSISIAVILPDGELLEEKIANRRREVARWVKRLKKACQGRVVSCYEAGPCGYGLQRQLRELGVECQVVAPSLISEKRGGERIKTDRRDALKLAQFLAAGMLEEVYPPTPEQEAVRELCRCRQGLARELTRARHQVTKLLLRRGLRFEGGRNWTQRHRRWLRGLRFEQAVDQEVFEIHVLKVERVEEQLKYVDERLFEISEQEDYLQTVSYLRCFRGIERLTAMTLVCELYSFGRFASAPGLMNFVGLVVGEHSSGERRRGTGITKAGNSQVRRVLVESSWHYRHRPWVGAVLSKRRQGQPEWVVATADKAMLRLNRRYHHLVWAGKHPNEAVVAVARELTGFVWAVLHRHSVQSCAVAA